MSDIISGLNRLVRRDRTQFVRQLSDYFQEYNSVKCDSERKLYIVPVSADVSDSLMHQEVSLRFTLDEKKPTNAVSLQEVAAIVDREPQKYEFYLSPGTEVTGRQVLFFTFTSTESLERNIRKFQRFVRQSYVAPAQIVELNRQYWQRLVFERRRLENEHSLLLDDQGLTEMWHRARYFANSNYGRFRDRSGRLLDIDDIVQSAMEDILSRTGPPFPRNLIFLIFHAVETEVFGLADMK